ncbi:YceD family protein [Thermaurantiacus sp.]
MTTPEFSHRLPLDRLTTGGETVRLAAGPEARAGLAARFGLLALDRLEAVLEVRRVNAGAEVRGRVIADVALACVVSGEPVVLGIEEPLSLRFAAAIAPPAEEVELSADDLDTLPFDDGAIDLGEAVAQSLALALPPYPRRPGATAPGLLSEEEAERARRRASPFEVLRSR